MGLYSLMGVKQLWLVLTPSADALWILFMCYEVIYVKVLQDFKDATHTILTLLNSLTFHFVHACLTFTTSNTLIYFPVFRDAKFWWELEGGGGGVVADKNGVIPNISLTAITAILLGVYRGEGRLKSLLKRKFWIVFESTFYWLKIK